MTKFTCVAVAAIFSLCASVASAGNIVAKVQYLDFLYNGTASGTYGGYAGVGHPDFESSNCGLATGLVQSTLINRRPVFASSRGNGTCDTIASKQSFQSWFRSTPGINVPIRGTLTLTDIGGGSYQFSSSKFYPLDGKGFSTDGFQTDHDCGDTAAHNFSYTMQAHWTSTITSNAQGISITGDDDIWLFVNNRLVIDLGGVHGATTGSVTFSIPEMIILGISLNQPVTFDLFRVERHTCASTFTLTTNLTP
jgi:fibro-slime domain-containing protein